MSDLNIQVLSINLLSQNNILEDNTEKINILVNKLDSLENINEQYNVENIVKVESTIINTSDIEQISFPIFISNEINTN